MSDILMVRTVLLSGTLEPALEPPREKLAYVATRTALLGLYPSISMTDNSILVDAAATIAADEDISGFLALVDTNETAQRAELFTALANEAEGALDYARMRDCSVKLDYLEP